MKLLYATKDEISAKVALLPIGSIEQHGPHLPLGTDSIIAEEVARRVEEMFKDKVALLPTIYYSCSLEHKGFPYVGVSYLNFANYLLDLLNSLKQIFKAVIIVNGHGGNESILDVVRRQINFTNDGFKVYVFNLAGRHKELFEGLDMHAGSLESSEVKAINPNLVKEERLREVKDYSVKKGVFETITSSEANPYGIVNLGGEVIVDEEKGKRALEFSINELAKLVEEILEK